MKHAYGAPSHELEDIQRANDEAKVRVATILSCPFVAPEGRCVSARTLEQRELQHFFKAEIKPIKRMGDLHRTILQRIIFARLAEPHAGALRGDECGLRRVELDHSDSAGKVLREHGKLTANRDMSSRYKSPWKKRGRLQLHGLTPSELDRFGLR